MTRFKFWKARFTELVIAVVMATAIISLAGQINEQQRDAVSPDAWLRINEVYVPDYPAGEPPMILYDRVIRENFTGFWIVEVQRKTKTGLWSTACSGNGVNEYDPAEVIENNRVTWEWYIGKPCIVDTGVYRLKTTYDMTRPGWPAKRLFSLSNEFIVHRQDGTCPVCGGGLEP
tara:strand:- start:18960 stop:19481 length:522 start_codon:yes stop_codon:yes gene_type:complete